MNLSFSTCFLILAVISSLSISADAAASCEKGLVRKCFGLYRRYLRQKPSYEEHCSRVQVKKQVKCACLILSIDFADFLQIKV